MSHDELVKMGKRGVGSSLEKLTAMGDVAKPLADTFRKLEAFGAVQAFKALEDQNKTLMAAFELKGIAFSAAEAVRSLENSGVTRAIREMEERNKAVMVAFQPHVDAIERADRLFRESALFKCTAQAAEALKTFESSFRLPVFEECAKLAAEFAKSPAVETLSALSRAGLDMEAVMGLRSVAWLNAADAPRSIGAVAEMQGIGGALATMPAFHDTLVGGLRASLGDWRDPIDWPRDLFSDLVVRTEFYEGLGFNPALTQFPYQAFEEGLDVSGIRQPPPPLLVVYEPPVPRADSDAMEDDLARTNQAHDWLQRLESQLRAFIDARMTAIFGAQWPRHRLPNGMYERWQDKQRKAEKAGTTARHVIAYADFTDYELLICKRDNWTELFGAFFARPESVRESFQRLYPIRIDTMHARSVTHDDLLLLYVEARRLMNMIGA